ncbi:MAG: peptidoglycan endopeptidase [Microbacteriaceae bacterium]|nr:peptidoglycan endopeptidase [Microbacteriaceae bacterium]
MAKKPSGRRRADVEINVLESFELRSRRSIRESERKKQSRATRRAEKKAAKQDRKYFAANPPSHPITAVNTLIKAEPKLPLRKRSGFRNALVMAFNSGVIATVALPAYAFSPAVTAVSGLTSANSDSQTITLLRETAVNYERGSIGMMSAEDILRMTNRNNYLSYTGLTAIDYAQSPNYDTLNPEDILKVAQKYVGVPYVLGGELPTGLDCSGYTRLVFSEFGILLPHSVVAQSYDPRVRRIPRSQARPGDLVIMTNLSHQGIYAGNGMFYHAPQRGDRVKLAPIFTDNYYIARVVK